MVFDAQTGEDGLRAAIDNLCKKAEEAVDGGANYIVLSDRDIDESHATSSFLTCCKCRTSSSDISTKNVYRLL